MWCLRVVSTSVARAVVITTAVTTASGKPFPVENRAIALPLSVEGYLVKVNCPTLLIPLRKRSAHPVR
jgi:hypothetical protein